MADTERQTAGAKVLWHFTMSLDGFVAGRNHAMDWMTGISFRPGLVEEYTETTGAVLGGRDGFDAYPDVSGIYGGAWALLAGPRRFTQLLTAAAGVSDRMLTKRFRELEAAGIVSRQRYNEVPPRVEYALTERGQALRPVIEAMERWGRATSHTGDPETAPP